MTSKITSRKRVKLAMEHKEADRIPIDFGAMRSTGISAVAYNRLRHKLGINEGLSRMYDFYQQLAYPEKEVRDIFHIDTIDAGQAFLVIDDNWKEWILDDGSRCLIPNYVKPEVEKDGTVLVKNKDGLTLSRKPKTSLYLDQVYWPLRDMPSIPDDIDIEKMDKLYGSFPSPPWHLDIYNEVHYGIFIEKIRNLYESTDYSIMLGVGCNLLEAGNSLRGMDNFLMDIYTDKKGTERLLDSLTDNYLKLLDRVIKGVGQYVDIFQFGDDLGGQNGAFMSPDIFKDIFKPRYKKMWDFVHDRSSCRVFLHSCGSIYEVLPHLIDAGLEVLNPVQTTVKNMEPERLKCEFGKDITFWGGGCNTRDILPYKSPGEVREDVKRRIEIFSKGGGFVFNQIHNILADVPPENVIAMFEAAYEYGGY